MCSIKINNNIITASCPHTTIHNTCQDSTSRQGIAPFEPPSVGFEPPMLSTTLQDKTQIEPENQDSTSSEKDTTYNITGIEQKFQSLSREDKGSRSKNLY